MSLVERALKKLQEAKGSASGPAQRVLAGGETASSTAQYAKGRHSAAPTSPPAEAPAAEEFERPQRTATIDRAALQAMQLLPPAAVERQIASQYQHIKRPLIDSALGKDGEALPLGHLIMLASAIPGEGKTFTSLNLALSMAMELDLEVVLVDADVSRPHLSRVLGLQAERGLMDLLVDSALHAGSLILPTNVAGLSILPAGRQLPNATELLSSERMQQVVRQIGGTSGRRIVLFDSPPLLLSTESRAVTAAVGQVVLVVRAESTLQRAVSDALDVIGEGKPVSLVLNQSESAPSDGYYGYGSYGETQSGVVARQSN